MNYEKKYKEALEKAKRFCALPTDKATMEDIFPELRKEEKPLTPFQQCLNCILRGVYYAEVPDEKVNEFIVNVVRTRTDELIKLAKIHEYTDCQLREGEDERIRKALIDALKVSETIGELKFRLPYPTREECISYLEKQKEQKPAEYIKRNSKEWYSLLAEQYDKGFWKGKAEQKPIKWNEEDENIRKQLISICDEWLNGGYNARPCLDDVRWLKNLLENQKEPTTVEWNEEDKDYYDTIVRKLEVIGDDSGLSSNQIKFLHEHCPLHRSEWSEEDETIIEGACSALEIHGHTKLASMLKSLRPQPKQRLILTEEQEKKFGHLFSRPSWRPSDEQMNYLCNAVDAAIRKHNESVSGYEPARVLKSLYEDLKKL